MNSEEIIVRGNADYVPVFRMFPIGYKVTYKYKIDKLTYYFFEYIVLKMNIIFYF